MNYLNILLYVYCFVYLVGFLVTLTWGYSKLVGSMSSFMGYTYACVAWFFVSLVFWPFMCYGSWIRYKAKKDKLKDNEPEDSK